MAQKSRFIQTQKPISEIRSWHEASILELNPKFQRRKVWQKKGRAYFIDTLMRGLPCPKIYVRQMVKHGKRLFEVVDGQQRLRTILDFLNNELSISGIHNEEFAGLTFAELPKEEQEAFLDYKLSIDLLENISDKDVLEIFARLNSYTLVLNAQEKRNAKYFGEFKTISLELSQEALEFWRRFRILSDLQILRMAEVELTSELLIAMLHGLQDKKKSIDKFYKDYDPEFPGKTRVIRQFRATLDLISSMMGDSLIESNFHRRVLFYSLFCAFFDVTNGLPGSDSTRVDNLETKSEVIRDALIKLSGRLNEDDPPKRYTPFIEACARQTDNLIPRQTRHEFIVKAITERS